MGRRHVRLSQDLGATAVEYAVMVTLVAVIIIAAVTLLGLNAAANFGDPTLSSALS